MIVFILLLVIVVNLLLCLAYKLEFITGIHRVGDAVQGKAPAWQA